MSMPAKVSLGSWFSARNKRMVLQKLIGRSLLFSCLLAPLALVAMKIPQSQENTAKSREIQGQYQQLLKELYAEEAKVQGQRAEYGIQSVKDISFLSFGAPFAWAQAGSCVVTRGELQTKIDDLEKQKDSVNSALQKEAFDIFDSSYKGLNSATDASLGALLVSSGEIDQIQKTFGEAKAASNEAKLALKDAADASRTGRHDVEMEKMLESALAEAEAELKFKDAFKLSADVFERAGGLVTGDMSPEDLAKRFWESRTDVANALKELSLTGQAMESHHASILLMADLNDRISKLEGQQKSAPYSRTPLQQSACQESKSPSKDLRTLKGQEYERERKKYLGAVEAAMAAFSICVDKHQACVHSCDASEHPLTCYPQCGDCQDTAILKAQKELDDFDSANNFGYPKGQNR